MGTCGIVDKGLDSRLKDLGLCVEVSSKVLASYCLCLPSSDEYLVDENCDCVAQAACIFVLCAVFSYSR